jgi:hypothetical protein
MRDIEESNVSTKTNSYLCGIETDDPTAQYDYFRGRNTRYTA